MGKFAGLAVIGIVAVIGVFAFINAVGSGDGGEVVRTVIREVPAEGAKTGKAGPASEPAPSPGGSVEGERVTWRGPLVDAGLTGEQMDTVFERVRECLPIEKAAFLEMCMQGREADWYDEGGYADTADADGEVEQR